MKNDHDQHAGEHCDFEPTTGVCEVCGVSNDICEECDGVGYHRDDCAHADSGDALFDAIQAPLAEAFRLLRGLDEELCEASARLAELKPGDLARVRKIVDTLKQIRI